MPVDSSPTVLITRLSHIGDCILTLPLATAIRQKHPAAKIVWVCEKPSDQLLSQCPDIDEIILAPKSWMSRPANWLKLRQQFRKHKFDVAIDPQGITKSAMLARISGAKKRIGIRGRWGRELSPWLNNHLIETTREHIVERSLELLEPIGITNPTAEFNLNVHPASLNKMNQFLNNVGIKSPFAILNPGAMWASKRWDATSFAELANGLSHHFGISSVLTWAGNLEKDIARLIELDTDPRCVMAPPTSLGELAALCSCHSGPRFFVGGDTGPLHIASAMGTPCIGLHGTTRPQDSAAYGPHNIALQAWYQGGTTRERRAAENLALREISVEQVLAASGQMLKKIHHSFAA